MRPEKVAERVIYKWLKKGNMARAMRDILPRSGLSHRERDRVAEIVHDVVRYRRYYEFIMEKRGMRKTPENYVKLSLEKPEVEAPKDIRHSLSPSLSEITPEDFIPIINREPETALCINLTKISREEAMERLSREGFSSEESVPECAVITEPSGRYSSLVKDGLAIVQDRSSQLVARITSNLGKEVLDYCAGSGGKSLAMFSLKPENIYGAYDIDQRKLKALERRAERWGMDIKIFWERPEGRFDVVLVDAPCSGVGAAARNPEAKYREDFMEFTEVQLSILEEAEKRVGEYLVYVVCSYTPYETDYVVGEFLKRHPEFRVEEIRCNYPQYLRPGEFGKFITAGDIFYIAILRRT